jgi:hypothetical protein
LSGLGWETDFELNGLDSNIDGDSLTFNARGMCSVCGVSGNGISLSTRGTTYLVTFNALGRWKRTRVRRGILASGPTRTRSLRQLPTQA